MVGPTFARAGYGAEQGVVTTKATDIVKDGKRIENIAWR
jgi:hypothetical protein